MLNKIAGFFWRIAGLKTFTYALLVYLFFAGFVMQTGKQKIMELNGKQVEILDLQFTYTPDQARAIIDSYNEASRQFAIQFELIADSLYPVSYTFLFLIMMGWLFKSLAVYDFRIKYIHLLPFLVMAVDYGENACIVNMLKSPGDISDNLAMASSFCTSLKWSLLVAETFIIGASMWLLTFYRITRRGKVAK